MIGTPVVVKVTLSRFWMLYIMPIANGHAVQKPIATVQQMARGMVFSGLGTSSAMCVAQSRHANAHSGFIRPMMNAMPSFCQPVLLMKVAKTNLGELWFGAKLGTVIRMMANENSEIYRVAFAMVGRTLS